MRAAYTVDTVTSATIRSLNYAPIIGALRRHTSSAVQPLGSMLSSMGPAFGSVFTRYDCEPKFGEELLAQSDMFAAEPAGRFIRGDALPRLERQRIYKGQVLIAAAGTLGDTELYGRSILADARLDGKIVGPDSMTLIFSEPNSDLALYTYAFLITNLGISLVRATSFGTKILRLRKDLLANLSIPIPDNTVIKRVADNIRAATAARETNFSELNVARALIMALPEVQETLEMCQVRRARCGTWAGPFPTLTAWNYSSAGNALGSLQAKWRPRLGDVLGVGGMFNGPRFARVPCTRPHGVDFISQRDVFLVRPTPRRIVRPSLPDGDLFVDEGTLLAGSNGQLSEGSLFGKVAWCDRYLSQCAFSQHLLRINVTPKYRESVFAFLSSIVGQRLLQSTAVGTSIPMMRLDLLRAIPIPDLDSSLTSLVSLAVNNAIRAKDNAHIFERAAVDIIENEILPAWLN